MGFPGSTSGKESIWQCRRQKRSLDWEDPSPGEGNGNPLQYSYLENSTDRGTWRAAVRGVTKSWMQLSNWRATYCFFLLYILSASFLFPSPPLFVSLLFQAHNWLFKNLFIFHCRITALQCRVGFSHTSTWISHIYLSISPPLEPLSHLPPHPTLLGCHRAPDWVPWVMEQIPTGCLFYILWCMFQCFSLSSFHTLCIMLCP